MKKIIAIASLCAIFTSSIYAETVSESYALEILQKTTSSLLSDFQMLEKRIIKTEEENKRLNKKIQVLQNTKSVSQVKVEKEIVLDKKILEYLNKSK